MAGCDPEEIERSGGRAIAVPTDVAEPAQVYRLAERAEEAFAAIDVWVNGAAVGLYASVEETTDEEFDRVMRVNFLGQVHGVHAALPALRRAGGGVIIGISSVEGERTVPLHAAYSASKRAVRGLYDALRIELAEQRVPIGVTTILPASIDTPFFEHSRSKVGAMPKPPPPVYDPDIVAQAIVKAAQRPTREVPVGGSAAAFFAGQRLSPALTDFVMSFRRLGFDTQSSSRPASAGDNLYDVPVGDGQVRGSHSGRTLRRSVFTSLLGNLPRPGDVLLRARARY